MHGCDLCGSTRSRAAVRFSHRSLRSDGVILNEPLEKDECVDCGLVRAARQPASSALANMYAQDYRGGAPPDHVFYSTAGAVRRSDVFADWLITLADDEFRTARHALEIGAADGDLLAALERRTGKRFAGFDLHQRRTATARAAGRNVTSDPTQIRESGLDLIWAIAVLEHVPSPTSLLSDLRRRLRDGGTLLLAQPTQDVPSTDLLFADHLWHFHVAHLEAFAAKCGFEVVRMAVGHPLMPTYGLQVWRAVDLPARFEAPSRHARATGVARTVEALMRDCDDLDAHLAEAKARGRRIATFGLGETFQIARCYTTLGDAPVTCGLVDNPERPEYRALGLPVFEPNDLPRLGIEDVILTANPHYYGVMSARVRSLGARPIPFLAAFGSLATSSVST